MAKKEAKVTFKSILNQFMERSFQSLISVVAEQSDHIIGWVKDISGLKKKIRKILAVMVISTAGLGILGVGISQYLVSLYPNLANGASYILVGSVFLLVAFIYLKSNE